MERDRNAGTVVPVVGGDAHWQAQADCKAHERSTVPFGTGAQGSMCGNHRRIDPPGPTRPERPGQLEWPHAESHVRTGRPELTSRANVGAARGAADPGSARGGRRVFTTVTGTVHPACNSGLK